MEGQRLRKADTVESKCSTLPPSSRRLFSFLLLCLLSRSLSLSPCHVALVLCLVCGVCDTLKKPVCPSKTSPCVRSTRPRVYRHHAHMCFNMCAWCRHTRGRFERATPHRTHTHTHTTTTTTDTTTDTTRRQRQSCRLPALVLNNFDIQRLHGSHIVSTPSWKKRNIKQHKNRHPRVRKHPDLP